MDCCIDINCKRFEMFYRRYHGSMKHRHMLDYRIALSIYRSHGLSPRNKDLRVETDRSI